jgi:hypothetical protein
MEQSGTSPPVATGKSISWDHLEPITSSETQPRTSTIDQNLNSSTHQTIAPSTDAYQSDPASSRQPANSPMETSQSVNALSLPAVTPAFIQTGIEKANNIVNDVEQEFKMSFEADSHDLAHGDHEIKGEAQKQPIVESEAKLRDLGWHKNPAEMPRTLIGGVTNESLFAMIRRFNKVWIRLVH